MPNTSVTTKKKINFAYKAWKAAVGDDFISRFHGDKEYYPGENSTAIHLRMHTVAKIGFCLKKAHELWDTNEAEATDYYKKANKILNSKESEYYTCKYAADFIVDKVEVKGIDSKDYHAFYMGSGLIETLVMADNAWTDINEYVATGEFYDKITAADKKHKDNENAFKNKYKEFNYSAVSAENEQLEKDLVSLPEKKNAAQKEINSLDSQIEVLSKAQSDGQRETEDALVKMKELEGKPGIYKEAYEKHQKKTSDENTFATLTKELEELKATIVSTEKAIEAAQREKVARTNAFDGAKFEKIEKDYLTVKAHYDKYMNAASVLKNDDSPEEEKKRAVSECIEINKLYNSKFSGFSSDVWHKLESMVSKFEKQLKGDRSFYNNYKEFKELQKKIEDGKKLIEDSKKAIEEKTVQKEELSKVLEKERKEYNEFFEKHQLNADDVVKKYEAIDDEIKEAQKDYEVKQKNLKEVTDNLSQKTAKREEDRKLVQELEKDILVKQQRKNEIDKMLDASKQLYENAEKIANVKKDFNVNEHNINNLITGGMQKKAATLFDTVTQFKDHKNSIEYNEMMTALENLSGATTPEDRLQAVNALLHKSESYIKAKEAQRRPFASEMRKYRLALAKEIYIFAKAAEAIGENYDESAYEKHSEMVEFANNPVKSTTYEEYCESIKGENAVEIREEVKESEPVNKEEIKENNPKDQSAEEVDVQGEGEEFDDDLESVI